MNKTSIFLVILLLVLLFFLGFYIGRLNTDIPNITGQTILNDEYSWTRAICNQNSECIDVRVYCIGNELKKIEPISELVRFEKDFVNSINISEKWC
jgi:hypothetical protein